MWEVGLGASQVVFWVCVCVPVSFCVSAVCACGFWISAVCACVSGFVPCVCVSFCISVCSGISVFVFPVFFLFFF